MPDSTTNSPTYRILIVDDEPNIRTPLRRALNLLHYQADEVGSGPEALARLKDTGYDLMVLDMNMPEMDGVEVMQKARRLDPDLLIVVLTGYPTLENAIAAVKSDAVDYLRKPASVREIVEKIEQIFQKRARRKELNRTNQVGIASSATDRTPGSNDQTEPPAPQPEETLSVYPLTLDLTYLEVTKTVKGNTAKTISLTPGEADILACLISHPDQVLSWRQLVQKGRDDNLSEAEAKNIVRAGIFRLRKKIESEPQKPHLIRTVRNKGYVFASSKINPPEQKRGSD